MDVPIRDLVKYLYDEATVGLTSQINAKISRRGIETPLGVLSYGQIRKGNAVLNKIAEELQRAQPRQHMLEALSSEYYTKIPHNLGRASIKSMIIRTPEQLKAKEELAQLMADCLLVSTKGEAGQNVLAGNDLGAKYSALGVELAHVERDTLEYNNLVNFLLKHKTHSQHKNFTLQRSDGFDPAAAGATAKKPPASNELVKRIRAVYTVRRDEEYARFDAAVDNSHLLFHASRIQNWVGILSRGLMLPEEVTKLGVKRTDFGWLGAGIYFGSEWNTSEQYCVPSKARKTGFMLVLEVVLGKVQVQTKQDGKIKAPKAGFDSIHGNPDAPGSEFDDYEFATYTNRQHRMRYLIEFQYNG